VTFDAASSSALKFSVRRWGFSNSLVHNNSHFERNRERKKEWGGDVMHPLRATTHPVRFARTQTHFERTFGEIILDGGGIKALRRKMDSLAGEKDERATTIRRSRRVAVDWGQTPASTCTHARCTSRAADTRVPGRVRVRGRTGSVRARAGWRMHLHNYYPAATPEFSEHRGLFGAFYAKCRGTLLRSISARSACIVRCNCESSSHSEFLGQKGKLLALLIWQMSLFNPFIWLL